MMEIPAGKTCHNCRFFSNPPCEDACPTCGAFEDTHMRDYDRIHGYEERYWGTELTEYDVQEREYKRLPACLAAYPNGATIEIKPKEVHR